MVYMRLCIKLMSHEWRGTIEEGGDTYWVTKCHLQGSDPSHLIDIQCAVEEKIIHGWQFYSLCSVCPSVRIQCHCQWNYWDFFLLYLQEQHFIIDDLSCWLHSCPFDSNHTPANIVVIIFIIKNQHILLYELKLLARYMISHLLNTGI